MPALRRSDGGLSLGAIDGLAREFRGAAAQELWSRRAADPGDEPGVPSHQLHPFSAEMHVLPVPNPVATVAHTLDVTRRATRLLLASDLTPTEIVFVGSRIIELGGHELEEPEPQRKARLHLASAKRLGYFFTPPQVSLYMARRVIEGRSHVRCVLDPASGAGALLGAILIEAEAAGANIERVVGVEIDDFTAGQAHLVLREVANRLGSNADLELLAEDGLQYLDALVHSRDRPDAIVLNPPYGRIKFLKDSLTNIETAATGDEAALCDEASKRRAQALLRSSELRNLAARHGLDTGAQDQYRLFLSLSLDALSEDGRMSAISPSGWMGDKHAVRLRTKIIRSGLLRSLDLLPEDMRLFNTVNQETVILVAGKASTRESDSGLVLRRHDKSEGPKEEEIDLQLVSKSDAALLRIPRVRAGEFELFERLLGANSVKSNSYLRNLRGELDLTQDRQLLSQANATDNEVAGGVQVVRGDDLERYRYASRRSGGLLLSSSTYETEILPRMKGSDTLGMRLACRQVSYLKKPRRLSWALIPSGHVLANSCNYIALSNGVPDEEQERVLYGLLAVLNSAVSEWFFRVFNSNNHVSNYEINSLPLPPIEDLRGELAQMGRHLSAYYAGMHLADSARPGPIEDFSDALVAKCLGLLPPETKLVLDNLEPQRASRVASIHEALLTEDASKVLSGTGWFQHQKPRLSDLDMQMIRHVPQGGNWQDIPLSVPSERLDQIRKMTSERGVVRTTYYGRLRPDQPAYTIATYFNRPGNGTNIHPWEDRTISAREAARLQSFPDWYLFAGGEGAIRNQIGNAVPPRLAHAIGRHLLGFSDGNTAVDLFAGAGGMSCGLELAGWNVVAAVDNDPAAARTYRLNQPMPLGARVGSGSQMIEADLLNAEGRAMALGALQESLRGKHLDAIFGGPPCQGFSTAGWRQDNDARNDLAVVFLDFVEHLEPDLVVLENVEGLLSYRKGEVLRELLAALTELGYVTTPKPWVLAAETYGVPQMRRRVFLVGHKRSQIPEPPSSFQRCAGRREDRNQLELADSLPYPVTVAEALIGLPPLGPQTQSSIGRRSVRTDFAEWLLGSPNAGT